MEWTEAKTMRLNSVPGETFVPWLPLWAHWGVLHSRRYMHRGCMLGSPRTSGGCSLTKRIKEEVPRRRLQSLWQAIRRRGYIVKRQKSYGFRLPFEFGDTHRNSWPRSKMQRNRIALLAHLPHSPIISHVVLLVTNHESLQPRQQIQLGPPGFELGLQVQRPDQTVILLSNVLQPIASHEAPSRDREGKCILGVIDGCSFPIYLPTSPGYSVLRPQSLFVRCVLY